MCVIPIISHLQKFASLVAEIEPDKLLEFWDSEALSRRKHRILPSNPSKEIKPTLVKQNLQSKEIQTDNAPVYTRNICGDKPKISAKDILGTKTNEPIGKSKKFRVVF